MADLTEERFAAKSVEYETPWDIFDPLNKEFGFTIDLCATHENKKVDNCFTLADDALKQDWQGGMLVQSTLWPGNAEMDSQGSTGGASGEGNRCDADSGADKYRMVARHLSKG